MTEYAMLTSECGNVLGGGGFVADIMYGAGTRYQIWVSIGMPKQAVPLVTVLFPGLDSEKAN